MDQLFGSSTTPSMILAGKDLTGKVAIVTGGNCGIGYETVKALAFHGAKVYVACRDLDRSNTAIDVLRAEKPTAQIIVMKCDLSSLKSVEQFAKDFIETKEKLHMLICNAGIFAAPYEITEDGFEQTFQVNYLAHMYLIHLLEDVIVSSAPSRIILLSSFVHSQSFLSPDNISEDYLSPPSSRGFVSTMNYSDSKLCMILAGKFLADKYRNSNVTVYSVNPGFVITNIQRNFWLFRIWFFFTRPFMKSAEQGASTTIYCATSDELENKSGDYYSDNVECEPAPKTQDEQFVESLRKITQKMLSKRTEFRRSLVYNQ
ncbi:WW domain-containing oxidoreductase-like [Brevipalpus obovatus]|uniref:WW domain-containing oxidoreductase-like n=1 Tax=Brevipalpus obovatus TaxID=246614 RepID=UPI003D9E51C8